MAAFAMAHADARQALADWVAIVEAARWRSADDLIRSVPGARSISDKRLIFKIQGNTYRIVCSVRYADDDYNGIVRVEFIGTHAEYDNVIAASVSFRPSDS